MAFISLLVALLFIQFWGSGAPVQKDHWLYSLQNWLEDRSWLQWQKGITNVLGILIPVLCIYWLQVNLLDLGYGLPAVLLNVLILLYSFGRGDFSKQVHQYLNAWRRGDVEAAFYSADFFQGKCDNAINDWSKLHRSVFYGVAYRGFERMFAVVFWFLLFGAAGAFAYRLIYLQSEARCAKGKRPGDFGKLLWLLEWLPVRCMAFSMALAGNFTASFDSWKRCLWCRRRGTAQVLSESASAALGIDFDHSINVVEDLESNTSTNQKANHGVSSNLNDGIQNKAIAESVNNNGAENLESSSEQIGTDSQNTSSIDPETLRIDTNGLSESGDEIDSLVALLYRCLAVWIGALAIVTLFA